MYLVTGTAELGRLVEGLEEGLLVECRLGLYKLAIHPLEEGVLAESERVVQGLFDGVRRVAAVVIDVCN